MSKEIPHAVWSSRTAFILAAVGSAVGLGNIWKFPYMVGQNGGSAFVALYLIMVVMIIAPILTAELMLGRLGYRSPVQAMEALVTRVGGARSWVIIGWLGMLIAFVVLSYFNVISGWTVSFALSTAAGEFSGTTASEAAESFARFRSEPFVLIFWSALFMAVTVFVVSRGVNKGLERAVTYLMPILFGLLLLLIIYSATTANFSLGWNFLFDFDLSSITGRVVLMALGQAFLSNSVAMGIMLTYGSYTRADISLPKSALIISGADTLVALMAGLAIFPLVFSYGLEPSEGPGLIFVTLPIAFGQMPAGQFVGTLFFFLLAIAALTSTISLLEPVVSHLTERYGIGRSRVAIFGGVAAFLAGLPSLLSFNILADHFPLAWISVFADANYFDIIDSVINNILLPVSGLLIVGFVGWKLPKKLLRSEFAAHREVYFNIWRFIVRYFAPIALVAILISNLVLNMG